MPLDELDRFLEREFDERLILVGTPDECIEKIQEIHDRTDFDELKLRVSTQGWNPADTERTIELLGEKVLPSF